MRQNMIKLIITVRDQYVALVFVFLVQTNENDK